MKKLFFALLFMLLFTKNTYANGIKESNLDYLRIVLDDSNSSPYIEYHDKSVEYLKDENQILLFINGSIIKNSNIIIEDNRSLVPIRLISEELNFEVNWNSRTREIKILGEDIRINFKVDSKYANINGLSTELDIPARIYNDTTYVPLRFVSEAFSAVVTYSDGNNEYEDNEYEDCIIPTMRQIIIDKYPINAKIIEKEEAIELLKNQLIIAYEYRNKLTLDDEEIWSNEHDKNLRISSENSRFYVSPVYWDFWIDKYTGKILVFYKGANLKVYEFNPYEKDALSFAG